MENNNIDYFTMKIPFKNIRKVIKDIEATTKETNKILKKNKKEQKQTEKEIKTTKQLIKFENIDVKDEYNNDKRKIIKAVTDKRLTGTVAQRLLKLAGSDRKNADVKYKKNI